jgi:hypothetical protein
MASPILATPTLHGEEAIRFLKEVLEEQRNPSPERLKILEEARKMKFKVKY